VGTNPHTIVEQSTALLHDRSAYHAMQLRQCPFGDGQSALRIADVLTGRQLNTTMGGNALPMPVPVQHLHTQGLNAYPH
jgi:UDP-N-acetylglucosamine 2-epimerase